MSTFGRHRRRRESELDVDIDRYNELIEDIIEGSKEDRANHIGRLIQVLPEATDFSFILALTRFVERISNYPDVHDHSLAILEDIVAQEEMERDRDRDPTFVRFAAFHTITIHNYKNENISDWGEYHDTYGGEFRGWESESVYAYDYAMYKYYTGEPGKIDESRATLRRLKDGELARNPGVIHAYVVCVLRALDCGLEVDREELEVAEETVQRAIRLYPYSEYFLNWGRIQGELGNYQDGIRTIEEGMDREAAYTKLGRYRHHINNLRFEQQRRTMENYLTELENELDSIDEQAQNVAQNLRAETLQFLGFFAAIVTFIITTVQIGTSFTDLSSTATLIPLMTGCLVLSFSALRFLFEDDPFEQKTPIILVWAVGFGLFVIAGIIYVLL